MGINNNELENSNSVRLGDVYALLVEYYYSKNKHTQAYNTIKRMKNNNIVLDPYLDTVMIKDICQKLNIQIDEIYISQNKIQQNDIEEDDIISNNSSDEDDNNFTK